jgi:hypothetical protein
MQPRPESRVESLEKRATAIEAGIIELSNDTAQELKVIHQDIKQLDERVQSGFLEIGTLFDRNFESFAAIETRLDNMQTDITSIKSTQEQILRLLQQKSGE